MAGYTSNRKFNFSSFGGGGSNHPFKIKYKKKTIDGFSRHYVAVNYHSALWRGFEEVAYGDNNGSILLKPLDIENLDTDLEMNDPKTTKNVLICLDVKIVNFTPTEAKINTRLETETGIAPFSYENGLQTYAQAILGVIVNDTEKTPGEASASKSVYVHQKVFTDLLITNMHYNSKALLGLVPYFGYRYENSTHGSYF
jgi:hypothetical protein